MISKVRKLLLAAVFAMVLLTMPPGGSFSQTSNQDGVDKSGAVSIGSYAFEIDTVTGGVRILEPLELTRESTRGLISRAFAQE